MVHEVHDLKSTMFDYLEHSLRYKPHEIAVMVESNSGLAQALVQDERKRAEERALKEKKHNSADDVMPFEFLFPLQAAELRNAYEKAGLLNNKRASDPAPPSGCTYQPPREASLRDLPCAFTPATSAALDEMSLTQVLTTIARRPYQAVGVFATDPNDVVFLAKQVGRFCTNVRLFTISSDLMLTRPGEGIDLRGMIVASTYPLYPSNQWITTPFRDGPRVFFGSRGSQGLYNATVAHLWEMGADEPADKTKPSTPQLLEFGLPYDVETKQVRKPPIWINVVGERGLYPVTFIPQTDKNGYLYTRQKFAGTTRALAAWPQSSEKATAARATRPNPHLLFWLICLFLMIACFFVAVVTWRYVGWSTDEKSMIWCRTRRFSRSSTRLSGSTAMWRSACRWT